MSNLKTSLKSKFIVEDLNDLLNESQFLNASPETKPETKKQTKRQRPEMVAKESINPVISKKKKISEGVEDCGDIRQKIINMMDEQFQTRKQINENLLKSFLDVITQMESDYAVMKENEQKLEHLTGSFLKCMQQATNAHKQKLKSFREIHSTFKKECDDAESMHRVEINKLGKDLDEDMNKLKEKLISDTKRNGWETLRKSFIQAMQNDF